MRIALPGEKARAAIAAFLAITVLHKSVVSQTSFAKFFGVDNNGEFEEDLTLLCSSHGLRLKEPVPRRRVFFQLLRASQLLPRKQNALQMNVPKPRSPQTVAHLERLPKVLLEALVAEFARVIVLYDPGTCCLRPGEQLQAAWHR